MKRFFSLLTVSFLVTLMVAFALAQVPASLIRSAFVLGVPSAQSSSGYPLTALSVSNFSWVNQGSATASSDYSGVQLVAPAVSGDNLRCLMQALPATPYTITLHMQPTFYQGNFPFAGMGLYDPVSGKLMLFGLTYNGGYGVTTYEYNSTTSFNSAPYGVGPAPLQGASWLRIHDDGTTRTYYISYSGGGFMQLYSESHTTWLTPVQVGLVVDSNNSTYQASAYFDSFLVTNF